jgi:N-methylhydantoinase A/oxoprolinase/acetone carboxylase beta subunit
MGKKEIRVGIDVGGTHTKAVAIDNRTREIVGKPSVVKTTHDHPMGVAAGVVESFQNCLRENGIESDEVIFVAHSTTQATNALLEGDVADVGIFAVANGGLEGFLAKRQSRIPDIDLRTGRKITIKNEFVKRKELTDAKIDEVIQSLQHQGSQVIVSTMAFGVDRMTEEQRIKDSAIKAGLMSTMASEITKLYGLTRRTRTAAINASILPKMLNTANSTEQSVRSAKVTVPLMIMRGDGGVMDIAEMRKRPILTMLSGPAASVMGSLMYLRASNGIYFEVGGTSTNIGVIKNGRPAIDYTILGGHRTYVNSLDVRVLGVAGGSMVRASKTGVVDVGPRSAHIAGLEYAVFQPDASALEGAQVEFFSPKPGDPSDYVRIRLHDGSCVAITNSCAANVLGLVRPEHFSYGNREAARNAMRPLADYMGVTVEDAARQILQKAYEKIEPVLASLAEKYKLEKDQMSMVGVGGGAAALIIYSAEKLGLNYSIPQYAEVISSIGVALSMVRDVVERIIPNPTQKELQMIRQEAIDKAIESGAVRDTIEIHIDIDPQTSKVTAIATGSTEVKTADTSLECTEEEAHSIAAQDLRMEPGSVKLMGKTDYYYVFGAEKNKGYAVRILDKKGFIKAQRADGAARVVAAKDYRDIVDRIWNNLVVYHQDGMLRPDYYLCIGPRMVDFSGSMGIEQIRMLIDMELSGVDPEYPVLLVGIRNTI